MSERAGSGRDNNPAATVRERFGRFAWVFEWTARWSWRRFEFGVGYDWRWGNKEIWVGVGWFMVTLAWSRPLGWYDTDNIADPEIEWNLRYSEAMRWRDWQMCGILIDERAASDWYVPGEAGSDV